MRACTPGIGSFICIINIAPSTFTPFLPLKSRSAQKAYRPICKADRHCVMPSLQQISKSTSLRFSVPRGFDHSCGIGSSPTSARAVPASIRVCNCATKGVIACTTWMAKRSLSNSFCPIWIPYLQQLIPFEFSAFMPWSEASVQK